MDKPSINNRVKSAYDQTRPGASHSKYFGLQRLDFDKTSVTVTKPGGTAGLYHPVEPPRLNREEYKRLGAFPNQFSFTGEWRDTINQIGNCVPPLLMRAVAEECAGIERKHEGARTMKKLIGTALKDVSKTYVADLDAAWKDHLAPRRKNAPTVVSLFAGCGGSSLGYSMAGYRELLAVEWDAKACATFRLNFPDVPVHEGDIALLTNRLAGKLTGLKPGELDVLDGSPPCQGFSTAGKRMINDPRNQLFREYIRILRYLRPKKLVMENVTGMVKGGMLPTFHEITRELRSCGYNVKSRVLNAMHYGVPQARQRVIFIGSRVGEPEFPAPWSEPITVRDAWAGLDFGDAVALRIRRGEAALDYANTEARSIAEVSPTLTLTYMEDKNFVYLTEPFDWHKTRAITIAEAMRIMSFSDQFKMPLNAIKKLGNSVPPLLIKSIAEVLAKHDKPGTMSELQAKVYPKLTRGRKDIIKGYYGLARRLSYDGISATLLKQFGSCGVAGLYHPDEARPLTVGEYRRIASFPDGFRFGTWLDAVAQMGNCVPPPPLDVCSC
jgi:DNA (cytosine-5)-methyltransferase 1